jgi:hypothetical protein
MVKGAAIKFFQHAHLPLATFLIQLSGLLLYDGGSEACFKNRGKKEGLK